MERKVSSSSLFRATNAESFMAILQPGSSRTATARSGGPGGASARAGGGGHGASVHLLPPIHEGESVASTAAPPATTRPPSSGPDHSVTIAAAITVSGNSAAAATSPSAGARELAHRTSPAAVGGAGLGPDHPVMLLVDDGE